MKEIKTPFFVTLLVMIALFSLAYRVALLHNKVNEMGQRIDILEYRPYVMPSEASDSLCIRLDAVSYKVDSLK